MHLHICSPQIICLHTQNLLSHIFHHTTKTEVQTEIQQNGPDFKSIPCGHPPAFEMLFQIPHALFSESPSIHPPYNMDSVDTQV